MTVRGVLVFALVLVLDPVPARADLVSEAFVRGNEAYWKGNYPAAVEAYEQVRSLGPVHEDLYFNLGNAYYRANQLGPAILNYERALALDPTQEDAQFNLKTARALSSRRAHDRIEGADRDPLWIRVVTTFTTSFVTWTFVILYLLAFSGLFALRLLEAGLARAGVGAVTLLLFVAAIVSGGLLGARAYLDERVQMGIVLPDALAVKDGPDPNYRTAFEVHAGLKVQMVEKDQDWVRVRLANGLDGWVRDRDVGRL